MIIISLLFLVPIWRLSRSKGYDARLFVAAPAVVAFAARGIGVILRPQSPAASLMLTLAELGFPLLVLILAAILPARPGAPGKAWLKITFPCPACGRSVTFDRELEGLVRQCPECDEIITVAQ